MQVSLALAAIPAMVALAAAVGRKVGIRPKAHDDWLVVPNLWGGIVARPGKMKSPTLAEGLRPLRRLAQEAQKDHQESMEVTGARLDSLKMRESAVKDKLKRHFKSTTADTPVKAQALEDELVEIRQEMRKQEQSCSERRYIVNDSTIEKLGELLAANPAGLLLERDELTGWLRALERNDRMGDREFFLEAWNGTNPYSSDRIGRGTIHMPPLCLSIVGGIQPPKLSRFVSDALDGGYAADGLLQRFQLLVWPEDGRDWELIDRAPDLDAYDAVFAVYRRLSGMDSPEAGQPVPVLHFSQDAQALFFDWLTQLEHRLRSEEMRETPAFESHLAKYRSLMPSLSLLFHLIDASDLEQPVSLESARYGADWCEFLEQHARKVYAPELSTDCHAAHALARKIRDGAVVSGMTARDIYNAGWSRLKTSDSVSAALAVLAEYGWARLEIVQTGGRPKHQVAVNPKTSEAPR